MKKTLLITAFALITTISQGQVTNGLAAQYSFNSANATDDIGSIDGSVHGATLTADRFGNVNKAYSFSGGSYIALPDAPALKSATSTVSLWVKINGYEPSTMSLNGIYCVINSTTASYFGTMFLGVYTSGKYFTVTQNNPSQNVYASSLLSNSGAWQHYAVSTDADSTKMYIDGVKQWSQHKNFASTFTSDSVYIGKSGNTTHTGALNGLVDDIRVYNRVLSKLEVDSLFNEIDPMAVGINETTATPNIVSIYPNPTNGTILSSNNYNVSLTDINGKVIIEKQNANSFDISNQATGMYFIVLTNNTGQVVQRNKIVKE